eukprot:13217805-Alexandrium_andersonii.AAC.1
MQSSSKFCPPLPNEAKARATRVRCGGSRNARARHGLNSARAHSSPKDKPWSARAVNGAHLYLSTRATRSRCY